MFRVVKALNFLSFKEGVEVSFELGKGQITNTNASSAIGIFGANGSGKSNLLKIFSTLKRICCKSANLNPDEINLVTPFYNLSDEVSFYVELVDDDVLFKYEIDLTPTKIISEIIHRKKSNGKWIKVIDRKGTELEYLHQDFKDLNTLGTVRSSASIISIAHYLEKESIDPIYQHFNSITPIIEERGSGSLMNHRDISYLYMTFPAIFSFVKDLIIKADLGIMDIEIKSTETEDGKEVYYPYFIHKIGKMKLPLLYQHESGGTQTLYSTLIQYAIAIFNGWILVIDEIEINLHPLLIPLLLNLFLDPEKNKHNAQIIFTSHRESLFDILGKYKCIITDKKNNESCAYRLDNLPDGVIRNDRPITPLYLKGLLGGIPQIGELLDSINTKELINV